MPTLNHDAIALHAHHLWQDRGCPAGCDTEIWLEAEWLLGGGRPDDSFGAAIVADAEAEPVAEIPS